MTRIVALLLFHALLCLTLPAQSATLAYTFDGDSAFDNFGYTVSGAGDVNGDGHADLIVGAYRDDNNGIESGSARVFSGLDGSILYTFYGDHASDFFGFSVSGAGDVNGDGFADLIVGADGDDNNGVRSGSARVFSGLDGSILFSFDGDSLNDRFGYSVSGAGDVNCDGRADFIVGAIQDDNTGTSTGSARVFSGLDGSILYTFYGDSFNDNFGWSVSGASDVNGDGHADVIVGARWDDNNGVASGSARVFSGLDGSILYTFNGDSAGDAFGNSVSGAGDVNGDGFADLIVGAYLDDNNGISSGSGRVFSGVDGSILYTFDGASSQEQSSASVSGAGDVNGDGFADLIVGAHGSSNNGASSGSARVFSGLDGSLLHTFDGDSANDLFGYSVSDAGDVNGDGFADVIVGALLDDNNGPDSGSARVFLAPTLPVFKYRTASASPHFLDLNWLPDAGDPNALTGSIVCDGATPGGLGLAGISLGGADQVYFGFFPVLIDLVAPNPIDTPGFGFDLTGSLTLPGATRQSPALAGMKVYIQFFEIAPFLLSSPGLRMEATL